MLGEEDPAAVRKFVADFETSWNTHEMKLLATLLRDDTEFVSVMGMLSPGKILWVPNLTVSSALKRAQSANLDIRRASIQRGPELLQLNLKAIFKGAAEDPILQPGDILEVPED